MVKKKQKREVLHLSQDPKNPCPFVFASGRQCGLERGHEKTGTAHKFEAGEGERIEGPGKLTIRWFSLEIETASAPMPRKPRVAKLSKKENDFFLRHTKREAAAHMAESDRLGKAAEKMGKVIAGLKGPDRMLGLSEQLPPKRALTFAEAPAIMLAQKERIEKISGHTGFDPPLRRDYEVAFKPSPLEVHLPTGDPDKPVERVTIPHTEEES